MRPGWWTGPDSVGLSSNGNGCEGVIKHRRDAPRASISLVLQRLPEACCGGGDVMAEVGLLRPFGSSLCASVSSDGELSR